MNGEAPAIASAAHVVADYSGARRRLALGVVALAFVLDILDSTVVNLAVPSIRRSLGVGDASVQWLVAGYALSFSMLLIVGGRLGDVWGYRRMFLVGVGGFAVASGLCGLAASGGELVAARVLQGAAAAMMAPQVMSLVQLLYQPQERGAVMGLFGALGGFGASLGPILGGLLIRANLWDLGWRPIFLVNLPVAALALVAGWTALPPGRSPHPLRPDVTGALLAMLTMFMVVFPVIQAQAPGGGARLWLLSAAAVPLFAAFVVHLRRRDRRDGSALAPPALFRLAPFRTGLLANFFAQVALNGYFLVFSLTLQLGLRLDVLRASLTTLPFALGVGFGIGVISRRHAVQLGRRLTLAGLTVLACGWAALGALVALTGGQVSPLASAPILLVGGLGMGMAVGPMSALTLGQVDRADAGAASGVFNAVQQLGGAIGAAALGALYFGLERGQAGPAGYRAAFPPTLAAAGGLLALAALFGRRLPARISGPPAPAH